jgi:hemoglobin
MIAQHLNLKITEDQRKRWVDVMLAAADEAHLPDDPEFRSAFIAYIEWGTRMAKMFSQPGESAPEESPMPTWGWGERTPFVG